MYKDYSELNFTDDFLFCKILQEDPALCKELAEVILGRRIGEIVTLDKQYPVEITHDGKGVRFDVYFEDSSKNMYDIEMQVVGKKDLPKRARYYQGMLDLNYLKRGAKYSELPNSTIIFICLDDIFKKGLFKYSFREMCLEADDLEMGDGTEDIFVIANGYSGDASKELKALCNYISGKEYSAEGLVSKIDSRVIEAISHEKWRAEYMTLLEHYQEQFDEGREEGRAEGREVGLAEGREVGLAEGRAEGRAEGQNELNCLYLWLSKSGRMADLTTALSDAEFRAKLLEEYNSSHDNK